MANISAIKLPNNTTYNLVDKTSGYIKSYTDEKLKVAVDDENQSYPILTSSSTTASTKKYSNLLNFTNFGDAKCLAIGGTASDSTKKAGALKIFNDAGGSVTLQFDSTATYSRSIIIPNKAGSNVTLATLQDIPTVPTATGNSATGISISDHGTTSVGSASGWSAGTASTWAFEEVSIPNVTSAGSASTWAFSSVTVANSISGAVDSTDSSQLNITLGTTSVQSKSSGSNGTAPSLGTAIKVQSKKSGANSTAPSLTVTPTTVVNGKTHSITDNGHTHTI